VATKYVSVKVKLGDENDTTTDVSFGSYKKIFMGVEKLVLAEMSTVLVI
jgi:hypothetical protein